MEVGSPIGQGHCVVESDRKAKALRKDEASWIKSQFELFSSLIFN